MATISFAHARDHAVVLFAGELDWEASHELVSTIETVVEEYFYRQIELVIASSGGLTKALEYYLGALRDWHKRGVHFRTRVISCAASAAAVTSSNSEFFNREGTALAATVLAFTIGAQVRTLLTHEDSGYEEWGVSGSVRLDPGASGRGLSLKLAPVFGAPSSGVEHLWSARDAGGLVGTQDFEAERRLEAELGYGIALSGTRGLLIPYTALSWRQGGARTHRTGARWQLARAAALGLEWTHEPGTGAKPPANALMLRTAVRW